MANFYDILGDAARLQGDFEQAEEMLEESLALYQKVDNRRGIAWALGSLGQRSATIEETTSGRKNSMRKVWLYPGPWAASDVHLVHI